MLKSNQIKSVATMMVVISCFYGCGGVVYRWVPVRPNELIKLNGSDSTVIGSAVTPVMTYGMGPTGKMGMQMGARTTDVVTASVKHLVQVDGRMVKVDGAAKVRLITKKHRVVLDPPTLTTTPNDDTLEIRSANYFPLTFKTSEIIESAVQVVDKDATKANEVAGFAVAMVLLVAVCAGVFLIVKNSGGH